MDFHLPKKKIFSAVLCGALMLSASVPAFAFSDSSIASSVFEETQMAVEQATAAGNGADLSQSPYVLKRLGLVAGNDKGDLMLDKVGTRAEALTLFISMQGEQDEARAVDYSYPFTDIPDWFHWCAGYGVFRSYTSGISATKFGSFDTVTPEQYMTFTLKALDYKCGEDFTWDRSLDKAIEIGLCTRAQANAWKNGQFRRQEIMEISYLALNTKVKGGNSTLTDKLIAKGKITTEQARQESLTFGTAYQAQQEQNNASPITCTNVPDGSYELHSAANNSVMTASANKQAMISLAADKDGADQQFTFVKNSNGSFRIASTANKDLVMDTNPTSGAAALLWTQNGTICQDFVAVGEANDAYSFRLANNPSMTLTASGSGVALQAYTGSASQQWKLSNNSEDTASASAKLASIMTVHPNGKNLGSSYSFAGASQCMGFGREVFYRMYDQQARWNYDGSPKSASDGKMYSIKASSTSYAASSIKGVISKAKPGDVLQMNKPKMHTMIFVSSDADGFTVYDANWTAANTVSVRYVKYGAWASRNSSGITLLHATNYPKN